MLRNSNLMTVIGEVAKYQFITKIAASVALIRSGIPCSHVPFWAQKTTADIKSLITTLSLSPKKIINILEFPCFSSPSQVRVMNYLKMMIGNMNLKCLRKWMRFVTGCSICNTRKISATFNTLSGIARRPIGRTCGNTLEISSTYVNYQEFHDEFYSLLDDDTSYIMNGV